MKAEQQEEVGRVYDREEDDTGVMVVFHRTPSLVWLMSVANLEFPGVRFDFLTIKATKKGKVSLVGKHEKPKLF